MQKRFKSITKARKFAKTTGMKIKKGKSTKMSDGTKGNWYTLTRGRKATVRRKSRR